MSDKGFRQLAWQWDAESGFLYPFPVSLDKAACKQYNPRYKPGSTWARTQERGHPYTEGVHYPIQMTGR